MTEKLLMRGELCDPAGGRNCTFEVIALGGGDCHVILRSPYGEKSTVDETRCRESEVVEWLLAHRDY